MVATDRSLPAEHAAQALAELSRLQGAGPDISEIVTAIDLHRQRTEVGGLDAALLKACQELLTRFGYAQPPEADLDTDHGVLVRELQRQCSTLLMTCSELPDEELLGGSVRARPDLRS
ncbi:MAG: hypothetical protein WBG36_05950 [Ornithinimicrobium sp.]